MFDIVWLASLVAATAGVFAASARTRIWSTAGRKTAFSSASPFSCQVARALPILAKTDGGEVCYLANGGTDIVRGLLGFFHKGFFIGLFLLVRTSFSDINMVFIIATIFAAPGCQTCMVGQGSRVTLEQAMRIISKIQKISEHGWR